MVLLVLLGLPVLPVLPITPMFSSTHLMWYFVSACLQHIWKSIKVFICRTFLLLLLQSHHAPAAIGDRIFSPGAPSPSGRALLSGEVLDCHTPTSQLKHHTLRHCQHCDIYFPENILHTIHIGCHSYKNTFQCNVCGCKHNLKNNFASQFPRAHRLKDFIWGGLVLGFSE